MVEMVELLVIQSISYARFQNDFSSLSIRQNAPIHWHPFLITLSQGSSSPPNVGVSVGLYHKRCSENDD